MTMEMKQKEDQCGNRTDPTCYNNGCSSWQTPPADIMEKILQCFTTLGDRIRMSIVCKSWKSIIMRRDICATAPPLFPWLLPPQAPDCSKKCLSVAPISEGKRNLNLKLPKRVRGGWIYGSSKGWFIIVKERGLNSKMFLLNPISRVLHHLASLRTIPFFKKVVKTRKWELFGAKEFCCHVALATHKDINLSESFTVAAVFDDRKTLCLCRPGDKAWTVTQVLDINENCFIFDILFSSGTLYALVRSQKEDGIVDAATRTLNVGFGDHAVEFKLKLVYDKRENKNRRINKRRGDNEIVYNGMYNSMLLESANSEVLLIHQMLDFRFTTYEDDEGDEGNNDIDGVGGNTEDDNEDIDQDDSGDEDNNEDHNGDENIENDDVDQEGNIVGGNDEDDGEDGEGNGNEDDNTINEDLPGFNPELRTRNFIAYKIDTENDNFTLLQSLGDQILFCGNDGSFSLPASPFEESNKNTIYFARNSVWDYEATPETYTSREIGFFKFGEGKAFRFPNCDMSVRYQGSWFTPRL